MTQMMRRKPEGKPPAAKAVFDKFKDKLPPEAVKAAVSEHGAKKGEKILNDEFSQSIKRDPGYERELKYWMNILLEGVQ